MDPVGLISLEPLVATSWAIGSSRLMARCTAPRASDPALQRLGGRWEASGSAAGGSAVADWVIPQLDAPPAAAGRTTLDAPRTRRLHSAAATMTVQSLQDPRLRLEKLNRKSRRVYDFSVATLRQYSSMRQDDVSIAPNCMPHKAPMTDSDPPCSDTEQRRPPRLSASHPSRSSVFVNGATIAGRTALSRPPRSASSANAPPLSLPPSRVSALQPTSIRRRSRRIPPLRLYSLCRQLQLPHTATISACWRSSSHTSAPRCRWRWPRAVQKRCHRST
jgi:hypothetical protein